MTKIEKVQFFAQYWGQKVGCTKYTDGMLIGKSNFGNIEWLKLTRLEYITDEDAIAVLHILSTQAKDKYTDSQLIEIKHSICELFSDSLKIDEIVGDTLIIKFFEAYDYLRSKSYLLPWRNYTVEQLIEEGIVKTRQL